MRHFYPRRYCNSKKLHQYNSGYSTLLRDLIAVKRLSAEPISAAPTHTSLECGVVTDADETRDEGNVDGQGAGEKEFGGEAGDDTDSAGETYDGRSSSEQWERGDDLIMLEFL